MEPFYQTSNISTVASLSGGLQPATVEGRALDDGGVWADSALQSVADDMHGMSVVAAGDESQLSVYDVAGSVDSATVESGGVDWSASVRSELAEAMQAGDVDVVVRGRRETDESGTVTDAEVGRLLVGERSEALSTAAQSPSGDDSGKVAALADVDGELDSDERRVLEKREEFSRRW